MQTCEQIAKQVTERIVVSVIEKAMFLESDRKTKLGIKLHKDDNHIDFDVKFLKKDKARQLAEGVVMSPNLFDKDEDIVLKPYVIPDASHEWLEKSREMNIYHRQPLEYWQSSPVESHITKYDQVMKDDDLVPCFAFYSTKEGKETLSIYTIESVDVSKDENKESLPCKMSLYQEGILNKDSGDYVTKEGNVVEYVPKISWYMVVHAADKKLWKMIEDNDIVGFSIEGRATKREIEI